MAKGLGSPPDSNGADRPRPMKLFKTKVAIPRRLSSSAHRSLASPYADRAVHEDDHRNSPDRLPRQPKISPDRGGRTLLLASEELPVLQRGRREADATGLARAEVRDRHRLGADRGRASTERTTEIASPRLS